MPFTRREMRIISICAIIDHIHILHSIMSSRYICHCNVCSYSVLSYSLRDVTILRMLLFMTCRTEMIFVLGGHHFLSGDLLAQ